jgi:hypothetical protein
MKAIALILGLYMLGLCVQPAISVFMLKENKVKSCCVKKENKPDKGCSDNDGCCDGDQCNPFFSQCPLCCAIAVIPAKYVLHQSKPVFNLAPAYFSINNDLISQYCADILHPPQAV